MSSLSIPPPFLLRASSSALAPANQRKHAARTSLVAARAGDGGVRGERDGAAPPGESFRQQPSYMNTMMLFQIMWSLGLACLDIYGMRNRKDLHGRALVIVLVVGDWIMASLTFTAASASAGAATLYVGDVDFCMKVACGQIVLSIALAFTATLLETISALFMLSLAVSFS